jgi:hypothetical protein
VRIEAILGFTAFLPFSNIATEFLLEANILLGITHPI